MKGTTYFRAYQLCQTWMQNYEMKRGGTRGIAVSDDECALAWQRYDRLASKCEAKIEQLLDKNEQQKAEIESLKATLVVTDYWADRYFDLALSNANAWLSKVQGG